MRARFDTRLILCVLLMMSASGGLAFADNAERMAEIQKALNVEVLAQPFSVAEPAERPVVTEQTQNQSFVSRCSPCGWPLGSVAKSSPTAAEAALHDGRHKGLLGGAMCKSIIAKAWGSERQTCAEATDEKRHRTRVVSTANRANLDYEEAAVQLAQSLTRSLAGLF